MPSFTFSSRFREGQWRALREFILTQRKEDSARFLTLNAEKERIGSLFILWNKKEGVPTEQRVGFSVSGPNSSLTKLIQAYTALGGNPFDISPFVGPESRAFVNGVTLRTVPNGGVLTSVNIKYAYDQGASDRDGNFLKFKSSRYGGPINAINEHLILENIERLRKPYSKEIWLKRTKLEEQIIKLCDLREQLDEELENLVWANYGQNLAANLSWNPERYNRGLTTGALVYLFDSIFHTPDQENIARVSSTSPFNLEKLGSYPSLMLDILPEEENTAL